MPTDEGVLNTLAYTFKACRAEKDLARCYENALSVQPNKDTFMIDLFFCYLRLNEPKKMQRIAQQLYKLTGLPMYVFWVVNSMLQQQDLPPAILTVAERMIEKILFDGVGCSYSPGAEELELYVNLLLKRRKVKEALDKLDILSARKSGQIITDNKSFKATTGGSLIKIHRLQKSNLRVKLLQELLLTEECSLSSFINKEASSSSSSVERSSRECSSIIEKIKFYISDLITEIYQILKFYPDQWEAHLLVIQYILTSFSLPSYLLLSKSSPSSSSSPASASLSQSLSEPLSLPIPISSSSTSTSFSTSLNTSSSLILTNENEKLKLELELELEEMEKKIMIAVLTHRTYLQTVQKEKPYLRGPYLAEMLLLIAYTRKLEIARMNVEVVKKREDKVSEERKKKEEEEKEEDRDECQHSMTNMNMDIDDGLFVPLGMLNIPLPHLWAKTVVTKIETKIEIESRAERGLRVEEEIKEEREAEEKLTISVLGIKTKVSEDKRENKKEVDKEVVMEDSIVDHLCGMIIKYIELFKFKQCCFSDIKSILGLISRTFTDDINCTAVRALRALRNNVYERLNVMEDRAKSFTVQTTSTSTSTSITMMDMVQGRNDNRVREKGEGEGERKNESKEERDKDKDAEIMKMATVSITECALTQVEVENEVEVEVEVEVGEDIDQGLNVEVKKSKNKKKKNKNKNSKVNVSIVNGLESGSSSASAATTTTTAAIITTTVSSTPSPSDLLNKAKDEVRARAVDTLCSCSKLGQIGLYCDILLENFDQKMHLKNKSQISVSSLNIKKENNSDNKIKINQIKNVHISQDKKLKIENKLMEEYSEATKEDSEASYLLNLENLFNVTKSLCLGGVGGDREVCTNVTVIL